MSSLAKTRQRCYNIRMTDDNYEPATLIKEGEAPVKPHQHRFHLPAEGHYDKVIHDNGAEEVMWQTDLTHGDVYRCTCNEYFTYSNASVSYFYQYDTPEGLSHWYRSDREGNPYIWTNVASWWKRLLNIRDMQYVLQEEDND